MKKFSFAFITSLIVIVNLFINNTVVYADDTYTDSDTGISFSIPDGWKAIGLSKDDRKIAKERFSTDDNSGLFVFLATDLYEQFPDEYKTQIQKSDLVGFRMNDSDAEETLNGTGGYDSYRSETIGGVKWYVLENALLSYYVQYINGNMIGFTLTKTMNSEKLKQVKGVIEEVSKNELTKENNVLNANNEISITQNNTSSSSTLSLEEDNTRLIIDLFIWIGIALLFFFIKSKWKKKEYIICNKCGAKNDSTNKFCIKCGEELNDSTIKENK